MEQKLCLACAQVIIGRSDKRFCDDGCRNVYHNNRNSTPNSRVRTINKQLLKNRKILADTLGMEKMVKVLRDKLVSQGYSFTYYTHHLLTQKGQSYTFVYEYGYLILDESRLLIVKQKEKLV